MMDYNKIPFDKRDWVKEQWSQRNYKEVIQAFKNWNMVGNVCGSCGIKEIVGEFIKYWVGEGLI